MCHSFLPYLAIFLNFTFPGFPFTLSSSFLSHFQRYGSTIVGKSPVISIFPLPVFLHYFPIFPSHLYILSNLVYPSGFGSFSLFFPSIFVCSIFLSILSSLLEFNSDLLHLNSASRCSPELCFPESCKY